MATKTVVRAGLKACAVAAVALGVVAQAQDAPKPTCNKCSATYIPVDEIQQYFARATQPVVDQQVRAVDIGKGHVAIGVVYRGKISGTPNVAEHDQVSEVYHIIEGTGTLVTGSDIVGWKRRPGDQTNVRLLNGPGGDGTSVRNGVTYHLKPGDVIVIPAGVGHQFTQIDDHIRYLMVRMDPDKVTPLKDEAASRADLRGSK
ncbi:MAG TPA: AraC family ligand binding domain-containing protein [Vicinamibacterales bacterium]|nr:AraC family ligand binding domain-containing protein [Vicinamibacterales bacterium]